MFACVCARARTEVVRVCMCVCVHVCMCACVRACVHACVRACVHVCGRACVRACMRACVRACVQVDLGNLCAMDAGADMGALPMDFSSTDYDVMEARVRRRAQVSVTSLLCVF